ncbi:hypothetical protein A33Q_2804 [Indibacter alkaliphilus LW1]|jgi:hypothetical protein|uniref:Uncharacterized protein n=1 Tax=Indibacter alkaliphilus (strain CCUG 57479 / KCTC 22604 / LW1) TaxID=1189612 RepID=S2D8A3_INDAL|nr:hypothetical protein [Indibacter alkaliphilus]EOZ95442.1 hypothetical protein A33Q_2804 [Indibacter alkaliphilus LW1]
MRVVKEFTKEEIRVSVYSWNNKYLLKFEIGPLEQTYKVPETEILEEQDIDAFCEGEFFEKVESLFKEMGESLRKQLENI